MGCGTSKSDLEDEYKIKSLARSEADSLTSKHNRKSFSSIASEGSSSFLRRIIGSNEKEKNLEPIVSGRKSSVSSPPRLSSSSYFGQPYIETMDRDKESHKDLSQNEDEFVRPINADASILCSPGSPSFRVYCVDNDQFPSEDSVDDNKLIKESDKESESPPLSKKAAKKERRVRHGMNNKVGSARGIRGVLPKGGSAGMKNILHRVHLSPSNNNENRSTKLIPKAV